MWVVWLLVWLIALIALVCVVSLPIFLCYARWNYGVLEKLNPHILVEKPTFFRGSRPNLHNEYLHEMDIQSYNTLGKVWGMYEGRTPQLLVADPELITEIFLKNSSNFINRRLGGFEDPFLNEGLDMLTGAKWKELRKSLSVTFVSRRMKAMAKYMVAATEDFVDDLRKEIQDETKSGWKAYNVKGFLPCLTVDIMKRCAFGTKLNQPRDLENVFMKHIEKLVGGDQSTGIWSTLLILFPFLSKFFSVFDQKSIAYFKGLLSDVIARRRQDGIERDDYLDLLMKMEDDLSTNKDFQALGITKLTVMAQAVLFVFTSYDTAATILAVLTYHLAKDPDLQDRVYKETLAAIKKNKGEYGYDCLEELPILSACLDECLRLYPVVLRIERSCLTEWEDKESGLKVKPGVLVQCPVWPIHYDPVYWDSPKEFRHERFLPENKSNIHPGAYLPFGLGYRNCIGARFAGVEMKIIMMGLIRGFRFELIPDSKIQVTRGGLLFTQFEPIMVKLIRRN